ncbi:uncharacterized protein LOC106137609 isoform X2 [Amyelois transitella]|uniref:uncharacterized protein LOC106137609 isoform X2 n=1 Tax=Amyelois transitella TaxID=680683 RepID=UPI00298FB0D4|nr:uncharacterized protein LOC106137609 isoform X2 [Amyelois transitella]
MKTQAKPQCRDFKWPKISFGRNNTHSCEPLDHIGTSIVDRTKKMTTNIEDVMKKVNASAQEVYHSAMENKRLSDEDLRQYEQLVIMKKYPYLDLKELEYKYNSAGKNIRQSFKDEPSGINVDTHDPGLCEPPDNINVEVFNRGLSGFTIPKKFIKGLSTITKVKENDLKAIQEKIEQNKDSKSHDDLRSLRHYIEAYLL